MEYLERRVQTVEDRLAELIASVGPPALRDQLDHVALAGGKRVRPTVTVLACEVVGGEPADAVDFAVGVELVHNASLVVDDIIDRSSLRRGTESAWTAFGYGPAIVASDGLLGEAFGLFAADERAMTIATEAMVGLGEGEAIELVDRPTDRATYLDLARRKTGALFRAAAELGAVAADAEPATVRALGDYAEGVGIAFQVRDDVLDATADADDLGKPTGQDDRMNRPSIVQVTDLGPDAADDVARERADEALSALQAIDAEDEEAASYLRDLAEFVVVRER